ncbi:hypothetical protein [Polaromonas sp. YR568]|uniref:hypothetical protein n=1 Tax=Polaromonas sp. YR568 TaxID=1855301 RepID=UPI00398C00B5
MSQFQRYSLAAGSALLCAAWLAGCAMTGAADAPAQRVNVEGRTYLISQLTAGTWTATLPGATQLSSSPAGRAALLQAIEKTSGCKVTDADYSRSGMQFDAQVDCDNQLKN